MNKVGKFSKVSFEQWDHAVRSQTDAITEESVIDLYNTIVLPKRATRGSAGYDIYSPIWFELHPGETILIPTGIRCEIDDGWFLSIFPRSGLGFKYATRFLNTIPVIDADYSESDNEGHIMIKLRNESEDKVLTINHGDAIAQGIFIQHGYTEDDDATGIRNGGFGSTGGAQ